MDNWDYVKGNIHSLDADAIKELSYTTEIVSNLVQRRYEMGMTQRQLADISGVQQSAIARLESFRVTPQIDTLLKLVKPLKLKISLIPDD